MAEASNTDNKVSLLIKNRQYVRQRVTRIYNIVIGDTVVTEQKKQAYLDKLQLAKTELADLDRQIFAYSDDDNDNSLQAKIEEDELYEDRIAEAINSLHETTSNYNDQIVLDNVGHNKPRLPELKLPEYSNEVGQSLDIFINNLELILNKHRLSDYEKFLYLRSQVSGSPRIIIDSLDVCEQKFSNAKDLLKEAFGSIETQKFDTIEALVNLKLPLGSDPYKFVGNMRSIIHSFKNLKVSTDDVLNYFIWNGLNSAFQSQLIQVTNSTKPSLDEILEFIYETIERYEKCSPSLESKPHQSQHKLNNKKEYKDTSSLAVNVKNSVINKPKYYPCVLCSEKYKADHDIKDCKKYATPELKCNKLVSLKACTKCSFKNHQTDQCRFKFKTNCRKCSGEHFTYLCVGNSRDTLTKISCVEAKQSYNFDSIMLPTFTADIFCNDEEHKVRVLKDSGSQRNFVDETLVNKLQLRSIEKTSLTVHGINTSKTIETDIVEIPLNINNAMCNIRAVVMPNINIKIDIPEMYTVAKEFVRRGYLVADEYLLNSDNCVHDINLILGADSECLLNCKNQNFGDNCNSSYIQTPLGVLFSGNVHCMLDNIKYLRDFSTGLIQSNSEVRTDELCSKMNSDVDSNSLLSVIDNDGNVIHSKLDKATESMLNEQSNYFLNYDRDYKESEYSEQDEKLLNYVLDNTTQLQDGRLQMPLMWNSSVKHLLADNFVLSKNILMSNYNKLCKNDIKLHMYNSVFVEQEEMGIIEKYRDIDKYLSDNPNVSFLPHMGVFKLDRDTTKCRVVFLSNLYHSSIGIPNVVSHNHALLPGPNMNHKLSSALILSRFDKYMFLFDIKKAFLNIALNEIDQNKLSFLWFNDITKGDMDIVAYVNKRLPFGLRSSPTTLMIALYKILMIDNDDDSEEIKNLKRAVYNTIYMDNSSYSCNDVDSLYYAYELIPELFSKYQFKLQQYVTNYPNLQLKMDNDTETDTPDVVKHLGLNWNRVNDTLSPNRINLDKTASTKRQILSSLNGVYDIYNIYGPMLNRSKLFLQKLQLDKTIEWDTVLPDSLQKEWVNISSQANNSSPLEISRFVGERNDDYKLVAFSDASSSIFGVVIYIINVNTNIVNFLCAKSKLVNKQMSTKSIPTLEFLGIHFAVEMLIDLYKDLSSSKVVIPVKIIEMQVYSDSMVCLYWLQSFFMNHDKMQKRSVLIMNRLKEIEDLCRSHQIKFSYIEGKDNPADHITRCLSYKLLMQSNYLMGPEFLKVPDVSSACGDIEVCVPNIVPVSSECYTGTTSGDNSGASVDCGTSIGCHLVDPTKYSSLNKLVGVTMKVLKFVQLASRGKFYNLDYAGNNNFYKEALASIISKEQQCHFPEVFEFFQKNRSLKDAPELVLKMNLFVDSNNLIRVKGKFKHNFPILLPDNSHVTNLIINNMHEKMSHSGIYSIVRELRKEFFIIHCFSSVKKQLKKCIVCKKVNARKLKLDQNSYREFRSSPPAKPFAYVYMDYIGPFIVKFENNRKKIWILIICCMWSRAVNLVICFSADVHSFLMAVQQHIYNYGIFELCISDLGSQLTAGAKVITDFLNESEIHDFLQKNGIQKMSFQNYSKGNSALGSMVEVLVKETKRLIHKTVRNCILDYPDFLLLVAKVNHILNRRPVSLKEQLRDTDSVDHDFEVITPENLIRGYDLHSLLVVPGLQYNDVTDPDYKPDQDLGSSYINDNYQKLRAAMKRLTDNYHHDFLTQLMYQSTDKRDRYKPTATETLQVGDIVLVADPLTKQSNYPLGKVIDVTINDRGDVTSARVLKGKTKEITNRHVTSLIKILCGNTNMIDTNGNVEDKSTDLPKDVSCSRVKHRYQTRAATKGC